MEAKLCVAVVPLFNQLSATEQLAIAQLATHQHYAAHEVIFQPGDDELVIVIKGKMKVYQLANNGKEQLLRMVTTGQYEGENQLFGLPNDRMFGEAVTPTTICSLKKAAFNQVLLAMPQLAIKLFEQSAQKMVQVEKQIQLLALDRVDERIASYLLDLVAQTHSEQLTLPLKMKELAQYLGTTPETLSRRLKLFEQQGYLSRRGKQVIIHDAASLETL